MHEYNVYILSFSPKKWIGGRWLYWHIILSFFRNEYKNNKIGINQFVKDHFFKSWNSYWQKWKPTFCLSLGHRGEGVCILLHEKSTIQINFKILIQLAKLNPVPMRIIRSPFWDSCEIKRTISIYSLHLRYCTGFEFRERGSE